MNIVDDRGLAVRLKNNEVSSRQALILFLIMSVFALFLLSPSLHILIFESRPNNFDIFIECFSALIFIVASCLCYVTNKKGDDKDFLHRFTCLNFPLFVQIILLSILAYAVYFIILSFRGLDIPEVSSAGDVVIVIGVMSYYVYRLNTSMKIACGLENG